MLLLRGLTLQLTCFSLVGSVDLSVGPFCIGLSETTKMEVLLQLAGCSSRQGCQAQVWVFYLRR